MKAPLQMCCPTWVVLLDFGQFFVYGHKELKRSHVSHLLSRCDPSYYKHNILTNFDNQPPKKCHFWIKCLFRPSFLLLSGPVLLCHCCFCHFRGFSCIDWTWFLKQPLMMVKVGRLALLLLWPEIWLLTGTSQYTSACLWAGFHWVSHNGVPVEYLYSNLAQKGSLYHQIVLPSWTRGIGTWAVFPVKKWRLRLNVKGLYCYCASPFLRPSSHWVCETWRVWCQTYGYLPSERTLPLPLGKYSLVMLNGNWITDIEWICWCDNAVATRPGHSLLHHKNVRLTACYPGQPW